MLLFLLSTLSDEFNRRALYDLYTQYQDAMLRVARRYFPNDTDAAEDTVQSAWLRVVENFWLSHKFYGMTDSLRTPSGCNREA